MFPRAIQIGKHRGFLVPLSAIIVLGVALLALAISRYSSVSANLSVLEGLSLQSFYAAESGAQYAMNKIFFGVNSRSTADTNCTALNGDSLSFNVMGLRGCRADISCSITVDSGDTTSFYAVNSLGSCGSSRLIGERIVEVSAFMQ